MWLTENPSLMIKIRDSEIIFVVLFFFLNQAKIHESEKKKKSKQKLFIDEKWNQFLLNG